MGREWEVLGGGQGTSLGKEGGGGLICCKC